MPTVTLANLQSRGFTLVLGAGDRVQMWSGATAQGDAMQVWWDSVSNKAYQVPEGVADYVTGKAVVTLAAVVNDIITVIPNNILDATAKQALRAALLSSVTDVSI